MCLTPDPVLFGPGPGSSGCLSISRPGPWECLDSGLSLEEPLLACPNPPNLSGHDPSHPPHSLPHTHCPCLGALLVLK